MQVRITERPELRLVGHSARLPLTHQQQQHNRHMDEFVASIPAREQRRLAALGDTDPTGLLQVTADPSADAEGGEVTYMLGAAVTDAGAVPEDLKCISVAAGAWAVIATQGPHPQALQETWARAEAEWLPAQGWQRRPGPSVVAVLERDEGFTTATCELWLPVEGQHDHRSA